MSKGDIANLLADELIRQLELGTAPWIKPWQPGEFAGAAVNAVTGRAYNGGNALWLTLASGGKADNRWCTFLQAASVGAKIKAGASGVQILFPVSGRGFDALDDDGNAIIGDDGKQVVLESQPVMRSTYVFHASDIEGLPPMVIPEITWDPDERAEEILSRSKVAIFNDASDRAFYNMTKDEIHTPMLGFFNDMGSYYAVALHELGHATGHESRLNRHSSPRGSLGYAREELVAEMASYMITTRLGLGHDPSQHLCYIDSWVTLLKDDPMAIHKAAADATKAVQWIAPEILKEMEIEPMKVLEEKDQTKEQQGRVWLAVSFEEKNTAKELGAKWDRKVKSWYISKEQDATPFKAWMVDADQAKGGDDIAAMSLPMNTNPREEFRHFAASYGLVIDDVVEGQLHRVPVEGAKPGRTDGAYTFYSDGVPAGWVKNHKTGGESNWKHIGQKLTKAEALSLSKEAAIKREQRAMERQAGYEKVAEVCRRTWDGLKDAPSETKHSYLINKTLADPTKYGLKIDENNNLVVPLRDLSGNLTSLQRITGTGFKSMAKDSKAEGSVHIIGKRDNTKDPIYVTTGVGTGAAIHEATDHYVICTMMDSNLPRVVAAVREKYADAPIIVFGDNDQHIEKKQGKNPGRDLALEAVEEIDNAVAVFPDVAADTNETDFADLLVRAGAKSIQEVASEGHAALEAVEDAPIKAHGR